MNNEWTKEDGWCGSSNVLKERGPLELPVTLGLTKNIQIVMY